MSPARRFISEPIEPAPNSFDTALMANGAPGLPREFTWRGRKFIVSEILRTWRSTGPCHHGSGERYVRRHWFEVRTTSHNVMKIYFDKGSHGKRREMGWFLFEIDEKKDG